MSNLQIDDKQILELFKDLSPKKQKQVHKNALRKSANILVKQAKQNLRDVTSKYKSKSTNLKNGWHIKTNRNGKVTVKSLQDGIKLKVSQEAEQAKVHIMGDFRLKWFELGTNVRQTKKGYNRGQMSPSYFFKNAREATELEISNTLQNNIRESILKAARQ